MTDTGLPSRRPTSVDWWLRLAPSTNARSVAALRIGTGVACIYVAVGWMQSDATRLPSSLWRAPRGMDWAVSILPTTSTPYLLGCLAFILLCVAVIAGYRSKPAAAMAMLLGVYLGLIPHLTGKVDHYHHVIWFLALIALAPSDDAWAVRESPTNATRQVYGATSLAGVLLLGVIYVSAGIPKLTLGLEWVWSDNMRNLIWSQWWEKGHSFPLPIDNWPLAYRSIALGAVLFEVLFLPLALVRKSRLWLAAAGITFHVMTWAVMGISFWSLTPLYLVLFDWGPREPTHSKDQQVGIRELAPLMLALAIGLGVAAEMLSEKPDTPWPVAPYPSFAYLVGPERVAVLLRSAEGAVPLNESGLAEAYGRHREAAIASTALSRGLVSDLLLHAEELEGLPPGTYDDVDLVVVSTKPDTVSPAS